MAGKNTAVFGIYPTATEAERAVDTLIRAGFPSGSISVLLPDASSTREFAHKKETKAPEGTAAGATAGGVVGGALGVLAGIGALAIPGIGPFIAAGPIVAGLAGLGVGGAVGGLLGALIGMGIPEYEAKRFEGRVKDGGNLLSVHCDTSDQVTRAKDLLKSSVAQDIASTHESAGAHPPELRADVRTDDPHYTTRVVSDSRPVPTVKEHVVDPRVVDPAADTTRPRIYR
jgi:hypothetical protein